MGNEAHGLTSLEVGEDFLETLSDGGEASAAEGEQIGGSFDVVEEGVDVDVVIPETGMNDTKLLQGLTIGLLRFGHRGSTTIPTEPSAMRVTTRSPRINSPAVRTTEPSGRVTRANPRRKVGSTPIATNISA